MFSLFQNISLFVYCRWRVDSFWELLGIGSGQGGDIGEEEKLKPESVR